MDWYIWVLLIFGGIIATVFVYGMTRPRTANMNRSIEIDAPADVIFPHMNSLKKFVVWSPWTNKDPHVKQKFEGPETGVGSHYFWEGNKNVGKGNMKIVEAELNKKVLCDLSFQGRGNAKAIWTLEENNDKTEVTWWFEGDMGNNPVGRILGTMMDKFLGPDYEIGLSNLKKQIEENA